MDPLSQGCSSEGAHGEQFSGGESESIGSTEDFREAGALQRAASTARFENGRRYLSSGEQFMQPLDGMFGFESKRRVERDNSSRLALNVINRPFRDGDAEHLFETKSLST